MILDIDPKVDYAFKHLFGRETTRPILINVLDSVLNPATGHQIQDIELLNPFNPKKRSTWLCWRLTCGQRSPPTRLLTTRSDR